MTIRILMCDDHSLVRVGLRQLISSMDGLEVVGETSSGHEAIRLAAGLVPDIVLMDIAMPEMNGLDATASIRRKTPSVRVLMISMHASDQYLREALVAGATGYILKNADAAELERAIHAVAAGDTYITPSLSGRLVEDLRRGATFDTAPILTPRQTEVLRLIAEGRSTREIAETLYLSHKTIETHRAQLMERLHIHNIAGLTRYAIRMGVVSADI